jgi:hypothetical protein
MGANERDAFVAAALRWMEIIVGDLPDAHFSIAANMCFGAGGGSIIPAVNTQVDDVIMYAGTLNIDGVNGTLGRAKDCEPRRAGSELPLVGEMQFDEADAATLVADGRFKDVVLHEMGHILGIAEGTWSIKGFLMGAATTAPYFTGAAAVSAWPSLGINYTGSIVPVESDGGLGTRLSHWDDATLGAELMTGFVENAGIPMPLSGITVGALQDIGYVVDMSKADPFVSGLRMQGDPSRPGFWIEDRMKRR